LNKRDEEQASAEMAEKSLIAAEQLISKWPGLMEKQSIFVDCHSKNGLFSEQRIFCLFSSPYQRMFFSLCCAFLWHRHLIYTLKRNSAKNNNLWAFVIYYVSLNKLIFRLKFWMVVENLKV